MTRAAKIALSITACYAVPVAAAIAWVWFHTKPQYHGMDWIGVSLLTFPGCVAFAFLPGSLLNKVPNSVAVSVGLLLNSALIYALATLLLRFATRHKSPKLR